MKGPGVRGLVGVVAGVLLSFGPTVALAATVPSARDVTDVPAQTPTSVPSAGVAQPAVVTELPASSDRTIVGDPGADRTIRRIVVTLLGLAGGVLVVTILFWRATRPIPVPLTRLSIMQSRAWRQADAAQRDSLLGRVRPTPDGRTEAGLGVSSEPSAVPSGAAPSAAAPSPDGAAASEVARAEASSGPDANLLADG